jgi:hypothetical protein
VVIPARTANIIIERSMPLKMMPVCISDNIIIKTGEPNISAPKNLMNALFASSDALDIIFSDA